MIEVADILNEIKKLIQFPQARICKHSAACNLISLLESKGCEWTPEFVKAVVDADDDTALKLLNTNNALVAKPEDAQVLGTCVARRESSNLSRGT